MNAKENLIRAIKRENPAYVPWMIPGEFPQYRPFDEGVMQTLLIKGEPTFGREMVDRWGTRWVPEGGEYAAYMFPFAADFPLKNLADLDNYRFPDPAEIELSPESKALLQRVNRDETFLVGWHSHLLYEKGQWLCGMENYLMSLYTDKERIKKLIRGIADYQVALAKFWVNLGVDAGRCSEDIGTQRQLMIDPQMWRELFKPEMARILKVYKDAGKMFMFHSDGNISDIVADLIEIGVDVIHPVQTHTMDLAELSRKFGDKICFHGAVDMQHKIACGTPAEIEQEILEKLKLFAPGGGFIAAPDQGIPVPVENVEIFANTVKRYGRYPLEID